MQQLHNPGLVPTASEGGNLVQPDLAAQAMTAPGSEPVTPLPPPAQGSHPEPSSSAHLPVNTTRDRWHTGTPVAAADGSPWRASTGGALPGYPGAQVARGQWNDLSGGPQ